MLHASAMPLWLHGFHGALAMAKAAVPILVRVCHPTLGWRACLGNALPRCLTSGAAQMAQAERSC